MATDRQIGANRRNAGNSTGPRSRAGRKRSSRNSYRHGLTAIPAACAERAKRVERLAREIAGPGADVIILDCARAVAQGEFDVAQVRQIKVALIERMLAFREFDALDDRDALDGYALDGYALDGEAPDDGQERSPKPIHGGATLPSSELEPLAEAVRRALPDLLKLDRYERRAAARRDQSVVAIIDRITFKNNL